MLALKPRAGGDALGFRIDLIRVSHFEFSCQFSLPIILLVAVWLRVGVSTIRLAVVGSEIGESRDVSAQDDRTQFASQREALGFDRADGRACHLHLRGPRVGARFDGSNRQRCVLDTAPDRRESEFAVLWNPRALLRSGARDAGMRCVRRDHRMARDLSREGEQIADVFPDYDLSGEARRAWNRERRGAFAGRVLMAHYGWRTGQTVTLRGVDRDHLELNFVILGAMQSARYPNVFAFRRDYLEEARKAIGHPDPDLAWNLVVRVDNPENIDMLIKEIDDYFHNSDYETRTLTESDALAGGLSALGDIRGIVIALCAIIILTVLIIAANSTAMMVRERIGEVAVMRSLGFSRVAMAAMLFGECGAIGLAGGILGGGAALWIFGRGASLSALGAVGALWVTPAGAAEALSIAIAVCIVSGVAPIWTAVRLAPSEALGKVV